MVNFRHGVLIGTFALCLQAFPAPATSAASDEAVENPGELELIVVVGSRVKRADYEGPAPVQVFDAADLENSGVNTLNDFVRYLAQNLNQFSEAASMTRGFEGAAFVDLRGIGIDATLTLLNGRRIAPYAQNSGQTQPFVDINAIPVAAIERIEILKDGASAIYGADAVAGVVNIVLKDDYEGVALGLDALTATEGDGEEFGVDLTWGWGGERTRVLASLSHTDKSPIRMRDRAATADVDFTGLGGFDFRSGFSTPASYRRLDTNEIVLDPECGVQPEIAAPAARPFGEACAFNYNHFANLTFDRESTGLSLFVDHEFDERLSGRLEVFLSRNDNRAVIAPTPTFAFVAGDHPNNFLGAPLAFLARPLDVGNRIFDAESDTHRLVAELAGGAGRWDWKLAAVLGGNDVDSVRRNALIQSAFEAALLGFGGPNGDQYYNPFGANPVNPPEVIDLIRASPRSGAKSQEELVEMEFARFLGALPGGAIGLVTGLQYRRQEITESADELELSGDIAGGGRTSLIDADREVTAWFGELSLPLHETLELQTALRYDDYSDFGSATSPKIGFAWKPTPAWLVRGTFAETFRPPSFPELFNPRVGFPVFIVDSVRCAATGAPADCARQELVDFRAGNPGLEPETGESRFLGVAFAPDSIPGLRLQLDYWEFEHRDRIVAIDPQLVLDQGGETGIVRGPASAEDMALGIPGPILFVETFFENSDRLTTRGIDTTIAYAKETGLGDFNASLVHTYIAEFELEQPGVGIPEPTDFAGRVFEQALPEHRANLNLDWQRGRHGASAALHYVDGYFDQRPFINLLVDDHLTLDLQYAYEFNGGRSLLRIGCQNCSDEAPPTTFLIQGSGLYDYRGALVYARYQHSFE